MSDEYNKEYPSFYAIIPAYVRYNKSLSPNAKLLFGEITALADKHGYCYASNKYFANVFDVDKSSITHWIKQLLETGCIRQELVYAKDKPIIEERRIYITIPLLPPAKSPNQEDLAETVDGSFCSGQECMHNCQQKTDNYTFPDGGGEIIHQGGEKSHHGVVKNFNGGGEISPERVLQANNTKAAAADPVSQIPEKPPPEEATTAFPGFSAETVSRLKLYFSGLDNSLVFDAAFYPKVLMFLSEYGFSFDYISFMYGLCSGKNPKNISGYLFRALLEPRYAELYLNNLAHSPAKPSDTVTVVCPVCGTEFDSSFSECPLCRFGKEYFLNNEDIEWHKKFFSMPQESRMAYEEELSFLRGEFKHNQDFKLHNLKKKSLDQKYGLS